MSTPQGAYGADSDIVDYILGITFEIWEQRGVELIRRYYADDCVVWGLDGITHGADAVVATTHATLEAFPDRLLLGEDVIWSGSRTDGYYSSHRLLTTMTNEGPTPYGPATGRHVRLCNIADCVVENGVITREWLVRDNLALVRQLGLDPVEAAHVMRDRRPGDHADWLAEETWRVTQTPRSTPGTARRVSPIDDPDAFARHVVAGLWESDRAAVAQYYAPYCALHRAPDMHVSGRDAISALFADLRAALGAPRYSVDHVASQPCGSGGIDIAVRWSIAGTHRAAMHGVQPTDRPVYVMGISHWRCIAGRIAIDKTVFDGLALLAQLV